MMCFLPLVLDLVFYTNAFNRIELNADDLNFIQS